MAAKIKEVVQEESELIEGSNGIFDVVSDGKMIFSKHEEGRFPEPEEVITALRTMASAAG